MAPLPAGIYSGVVSYSQFEVKQASWVQKYINALLQPHCRLILKNFQSSGNTDDANIHSKSKWFIYVKGEQRKQNRKKVQPPEKNNQFRFKNKVGTNENLRNLAQTID